MVQNLDILNAREEIDRINSNFYEGTDISRALAHWALQNLLADVNPDDDALFTATAIGGAHDLGLDAYWIDNDNSMIIFVQAKDTERLHRPQRVNTDVVQSFRQAIETLTNEEYVRKNANPTLREAYFEEISELLYDETYSVRAVLSAGGQVSLGSQVRAYAQGPGSSPWHIHDESTYYSKDFQMEVLDIEDLISEGKRLRAGGRANLVRLPIVQNEYGKALHMVGGHSKSVLATVRAKTLADIYHEYRSAIFQYNPRGPQASNKVNTEIEGTIKNPVLRSLFHMLNNGVTIVCSYFRFNEDQAELEVSDLQIVNGCQTVYTLDKLSEHLVDEVMINVRIVENLQTYAPEIARASNSQTAVRAEHLISLSSVHNEIGRILAERVPPWYYEKQIGGVRFLSARDRNTHVAKFGRGKERTVDIRELGRWGTAFLDYPIISKHDKQAMFERKSEEMSAVHDMIFNSSNSADQILLPVLVGRAVQSAGKKHLASLRAQDNSESQVQDDEVDDERLWLSYAYHHMVALIGSELRGFSTQSRLINRELSAELCATVDNWFTPKFNRALDSVGYYVDVDKENHTFDIRKFFRNQDHYEGMKRRMRTLHSRG